MVHGSSRVAVAVALLAIAVFGRRLSEDKGASEAAEMKEDPVEHVQEALLQTMQEGPWDTDEEDEEVPQWLPFDIYMYKYSHYPAVREALLEAKRYKHEREEEEERMRGEVEPGGARRGQVSGQMMTSTQPSVMMMPSTQPSVVSDQNIIWLDLELTHGHYQALKGGIHSGEAGKILEAAVIVTDKDLKELGRGQWVISGSTKDQLLGLERWHQQHFRDKEPGGEFPPLNGLPGNGLFSDVMASRTTLEKAEKKILKLVRQHCPKQGCPLAGNSIQCDGEVLKVHMPDVYAFLSHQILDVSTVVGFMNRWLPQKRAEWSADQQQHASYDHRALHDVESSIQSMRWARSNLFVQ